VQVPLDWLRQYVSWDLPTAQLAYLINMTGLEVEGIESFEGRGGFADTVLATYVTPNRGDWLSMVGVAREVAASLDTGFERPRPAGLKADLPADTRYTVRIDDPDLCPRYVGLLVTDVRIGPSPDWLVNRIEAAGVRAISNVVDITNFVMLEMGQPLHAFDFAKLRGPGIVVRCARPGESLETIDGKARALNRRDLVIADAEIPVAIAGVMGGLATEVGDSTTQVLIESAHFRPLSVRHTASRHGMSTGASFRFERHVDPENCLAAAWRAAELMVELCGGRVQCAAVDAYPNRAAPRILSVRPARVNLVLGAELSAKQIADCLRRLGITVEVADTVNVVVPSYRADLEQEIDLIEEVARIHGYDAIGETLPRSETVAGRKLAPQRTTDLVRETLVASGLSEAWTFSLVAPEAIDRLELDPDDPRRTALELSNPLTADASALRTMLAPCLLQVAERNARYRNTDLALFEVGRVYRLGANGQEPTERRTVCILLTGATGLTGWNVPAEAARADFYALKAIVESLTDELSGGDTSIGPADGMPFRPGACASVFRGGEEIGRFGALHPRVQSNYDLPNEVFLAEIDIEGFVGKPCPVPRYQPIPRFPDVTRDLALVLDYAIPSAQVEGVIRSAGGPHLVRAEVFDVFEGAQIGAGKKSLAYSLRFRSPEGTLTDEQVNQAIDSVCSALAAELGAALRT